MCTSGAPSQPLSVMLIIYYFMISGRPRTSIISLDSPQGQQILRSGNLLTHVQAIPIASSTMTSLPVTSVAVSAPSAAATEKVTVAESGSEPAAVGMTEVLLQSTDEIRSTDSMVGIFTCI